MPSNDVSFACRQGARVPSNDVPIACYERQLELLVMTWLCALFARWGCFFLALQGNRYGGEGHRGRERHVGEQDLRRVRADGYRRLAG